jgi:farnesyl-diphosphate farnesyltransferase
MNHLALLKNVARSFYLTIWWLPSSLQEPVALAYLLARASDTIVDQEELAFQPSERSLVELLPSLLQSLHCPDRNHFNANAIKALWQTILEGQRFDLEKFSSQRRGPLLTTEELDRYLYLVAGSVGEFLTQLAAHHCPGCSTESLERMVIWGIDYGKGLQLINILRDYRDDIQRGHHYIDKSSYAFYHDQAIFYLQSGEAYIKALCPGRLKVAYSLPLLLGKETLALIQKDPTAQRLKIRRWQVYLILLRASIFLFI